jgi:hypothetical protein
MHLFLSSVGSFSASLKCRTKALKFSHTAETERKLDATHRVLKILRGTHLLII